MMRDYSKNLSNYSTLPAGTINNRLGGAAFIMLGAKFLAHTLNGSAQQANDLFIAYVGSNASLSLSVPDVAGGAVKKVRVGGRRTNTDVFGSRDSSTTVVAGTQYSVVGILDFSTPTVSLYLNGVLDNGTLNANVTSGTYTAGTPTNNDWIGCAGSTTPTSTFRQFDGTIGEVTLWAGSRALTAEEILAYHKGWDSLLIAPSLLKFHFPLLGRLSPEIDLINGSQLTITGSVPQADHVPIFFGARRQMGKRTVSTGSALGSVFNNPVIRGGNLSRIGPKSIIGH